MGEYPRHQDPSESQALSVLVLMFKVILWHPIANVRIWAISLGITYCTCNCVCVRPSIGLPSPDELATLGWNANLKPWKTCPILLCRLCAFLCWLHLCVGVSVLADDFQKLLFHSPSLFSGFVGRTNQSMHSMVCVSSWFQYFGWNGVFSCSIIFVGHIQPATQVWISGFIWQVHAGRAGSPWEARHRWERPTGTLSAVLCSCE